MAVKTIDAYLSALAAYVNSVSLGDVHILITSGFERIKAAEPINTLHAPYQVTVRATLYPGQLKVRWHRVPARSASRHRTPDAGQAARRRQRRDEP
jgi:hypothetical protein